MELKPIKLIFTAFFILHVSVNFNWEILFRVWMFSSLLACINLWILNSILLHSNSSYVAGEWIHNLSWHWVPINSVLYYVNLCIKYYIILLMHWFYWDYASAGAAAAIATANIGEIHTYIYYQTVYYQCVLCNSNKIFR